MSKGYNFDAKPTTIRAAIRSASLPALEHVVSTLRVEESASGRDSSCIMRAFRSAVEDERERRMVDEREYMKPPRVIELNTPKVSIDTRDINLTTTVNWES